ncbi:MAG TPA: hypothetical protein VN428_02375 [Bryobacteraceae bacterium]|nr:hypothetical protein [Bryobacteraceae bacterium]
MTHIKRLNGFLADNAGRNPHGEPMFQWIESRRLLYPVQTGIDTFDFEPQVDGERWVLAKWVAPPSRPVWDGMFHGALPYPQRGEYVATDLTLKPGFEPTEWVTSEALGMIQRARSLNYQGHLRNLQDRQERQDKDRRRRISDCIDDCMTAFKNPFPGKRGGHVAYGGVS